MAEAGKQDAQDGMRALLMHRTLWLIGIFVMVCLGLWGMMVQPWLTPAVAPNEVRPSVVSLGGQWQFYWDTLLSPADFTPERETTHPRASQLTVPGSWYAHTQGGQLLPRYGVATYRTHVQLPAALVGVPSVLLFESVGSAYRIWVNGAFVGGLGELASPKEGQLHHDEVPHIRLALFHITPTTSDLDIVVQVSNHSFRESGIFGDVKLGSADATMAYVFTHYVVQDVLLIGAFIFIGAFHLITYVSSRRDAELLWLSGLCLLVAVRSLILNKYLLYLAAPEIRWETLMYAQYSVKFLTLLVFIQLISVLYRQDVNPTVHGIGVGVCFVALGYIASVPVSTSSVTLNVQTAGIIVVLIYYVYVVGYLAIVRAREGAFLNLFGLVFVCIAIIHDYYLYVKSIDSVQIVPYGLLVILLVQEQIISYRYTRFQQRSVQLAHELQQVNRHLEEKVLERTRELHASNVRLTDLAHQRSRLMANIAHDMGAPLLGVQSSLHILGENALHPQVQNDLVGLLITRVNHVKRLVDDLFQLAKLESRQWEFEWEHVAVAEVSVEMQQYFAHMLQEQGRLLVSAHGPSVALPVPAMVRIDRGQIYRVVQNLLENAMKFSTDPLRPIEFTSTVRLVEDAREPCFEWYVEIVDFGVGIAANHLPMIFERFYTRSSGLPVGSGLGLAICKEIIERHGGSIDVSSEEGRGSTFCFTVPIVR